MNQDPYVLAFGLGFLATIGFLIFLQETYTLGAVLVSALKWTAFAILILPTLALLIVFDLLRMWIDPEEPSFISRVIDETF